MSNSNNANESCISSSYMTPRGLKPKEPTHFGPYSQTSTTAWFLTWYENVSSVYKLEPQILIFSNIPFRYMAGVWNVCIAYVTDIDILSHHIDRYLLHKSPVGSILPDPSSRTL